MSDLTLLLPSCPAGESRATESLLPIVYHELRRLAAAKMHRESAEHMLQPTELVHEAWLRLGADAQPQWRSRAHFFAAAGETMRRILIDRARHRRAERHGGRLQRVDAADCELSDEINRSDDQVSAVHEALEKLARDEPEKAELVKLRYFAGFTLEEAADALDIPLGTAKRWWTYARARLYRDLKLECRGAGAKNEDHAIGPATKMRIESSHPSRCTSTAPLTALQVRSGRAN